MIELPDFTGPITCVALGRGAELKQISTPDTPPQYKLVPSGYFEKADNLGRHTGVHRERIRLADPNVLIAGSETNSLAAVEVLRLLPDKIALQIMAAGQPNYLLDLQEKGLVPRGTSEADPMLELYKNEAALRGLKTPEVVKITDNKNTLDDMQSILRELMGREMRNLMIVTVEPHLARTIMWFNVAQSALPASPDLGVHFLAAERLVPGHELWKNSAPYQRTSLRELQGILDFANGKYSSEQHRNDPRLRKAS